MRRKYSFTRIHKRQVMSDASEPSSKQRDEDYDQSALTVVVMLIERTMLKPAVQEKA
jgi:hypothetical protein